MNYYGLIQLPQLNKPELSGFILEVVSPYTGIPSYTPSGTDGQILFKSGQYSAGSALWFVSGKFGFGTVSPLYDFHLAGKDVKARNGYFDDLFVFSSRVATTDEIAASGQFITQSINQLSGFVSSNYLSSGEINSLFYPRTNPSGFLASSQTGNFVTTGQTGDFSTTGWIDRYYYPRSNPSGYGAGGGGGITQSLSLDTGTHILSITSGTGASLGIYLTTGKADLRYALASSTGLFVTTGQTGNYVTTGQTGTWVTSGKTGVFVTTGQTGNFITTSQTGQFQPVGSYTLNSETGNFVTQGQTGTWVTSGKTGVFVTNGQTGNFATTGWVDSLYYPRSNPSGFGLGGGGGSQNLSFDSATELLSITSGNSVSLGIYLTTGKSDSRYAQASLTGNFTTTGQTGNFYPRSNPSGYIQSSATGNFVTIGQTGTFVTTGQTGILYPASNPSGYEGGLSLTAIYISMVS